MKTCELTSSAVRSSTVLRHWIQRGSVHTTVHDAAAFSEPAGLTLKNVKLKTEALDFFQLPVAVEEAVVGSLHVRVGLPYPANAGLCQSYLDALQQTWSIRVSGTKHQA